MAELDVLEEVLQTQGWDSNIRDKIIKVGELSERGNGEKMFEMMSGGPNEDCKVDLVPKAERRNAPQGGRKAPPPRWTEPTLVKAAPCPTRIGLAGRRESSSGGRKTLKSLRSKC